MIKTWYIIFILFPLSYISNVQGAPCPFKFNPGKKIRQYSGGYDNKAYGFSTRIPAGFIGIDEDDPFYQRGFAVVLPKDQGAVSVFAEANSTAFDNAREAAESEVRFLAGEAEHLLSVTYLDDRMDAHSVTRISAEFQCKGRSEHYGFTAILALDTNKQFVYTLTWEGPLSGMSAAENIQQSLKKSWRFSPPQ